MKRLSFEADSIECPREKTITYAVTHFVSQNIARTWKLLLALAGVRKYRAQLRAKLRSKGSNPYAKSERRELFTTFYREYFGGIIRSTYKNLFSGTHPDFSEYAYIIAGSDQVWNRNIVYTLEALRFYYLEFAERRKRVCYAPSFGVSRLKFFERQAHRRGLMGFDRLSCREEEGCELIRELTGREAELVLDPTLLLPTEDWRKIARKPSYDVPEHYALTYIMNPYEVEPEAVRSAAGGLELVDIFDPEQPYYSLTGPREFLWLMDHADRVLTSSFHGTAFSVNFRKNFVAFKPAYFSRIRSLLSNFDLMDRLYLPGRNIPGSPIDYEAVQEKLNALRESSMNYLRDCLR